MSWRARGRELGDAAHIGVGISWHEQFDQLVGVGTGSRRPRRETCAVAQRCGWCHREECATHLVATAAIITTATITIKIVISNDFVKKGLEKFRKSSRTHRPRVRAAAMTDHAGITPDGNDATTPTPTHHAQRRARKKGKKLKLELSPDLPQNFSHGWIMWLMR